MKLVQLALLAFGLTLSATAMAQQQTVRIGVSPASGTTDQVPVAGANFFRDLADALEKEAGLQIQMTAIPYGQLLQSVLDSRIDVAAGPFTITQERRAMGLEFTTPANSYHEAIAVAAADPAEYRSLADLRGQPVGVVAGATLYENAIRNAGAELRTYPTVGELVAAIASGELKAGVNNAPIFRTYLRDNPNTAIRLVESYQPTITSIAGLPVRAADTELLGKLNEAIGKLRASGTLAALNERFFYAMPPG